MKLKIYGWQTLFWRNLIFYVKLKIKTLIEMCNLPILKFLRASNNDTKRFIHLNSFSNKGSSSIEQKMSIASIVFFAIQKKKKNSNTGQCIQFDGRRANIG